jgi:hypothetical protein
MFGYKKEQGYVKSRFKLRILLQPRHADKEYLCTIIIYLSIYTIPTLECHSGKNTYHVVLGIC